MLIVSQVPVPVRFNVFKHHRNEIIRVLRESSADELISQLDPLCNNYIDIYTGVLTPTGVGEMIVARLKSEQVFFKEDFLCWLKISNGHRKIRLDDDSEWIVRESNDPIRYLHIHPARTGKHTLRFKGSTLKTVFKLKQQIDRHPVKPSLVQVNQSREELGLSPVKKIEQGRGILKCYEQFF